HPTCPHTLTDHHDFPTRRSSDLLNATIDCPAQPVFTAPTATDNCAPAPTVVEVSDVTTPGTCTGTYSRTKTWKAVDVCGNESGTDRKSTPVNSSNHVSSYALSSL